MTARAHKAPAAEARARRAPSSLVRLFVSIALVYSQHNCDARGPDYTVAANTARMSQANDVARDRHFRYYLACELARGANCEPRHGMYRAERIPMGTSTR